MENDYSFGRSIKEYRRSLDLTQAELAHRVGCAEITIRKIEADELRSSIQIAERLAMMLNIPNEERAHFIRLARMAVRETPLPTPTPPPLPEEIGGEDLSGRAVHGYQLGERLGVGGFGAVYRATQPFVAREVAIKIILPRYANHPDFIRRFEAEAQLVARLEHPHIVPLYDYWREPNAAYLVMRLLRGGNLGERLKQGPLPLPFLLVVMQQIGQALHTAHRYGVVHRDIKPANILMDEEDNTYLADFGIAKNFADPDLPGQLAAGGVAGSPAYAAPEQLRAESVTPQADIYGLGVVLYEMLTGQHPFHESKTSLDYICAQLHEPLPPLALLRPELPTGLDEIIQKATAKDAHARFPDILAMLSPLEEILRRGSGLAGLPVILDEAALDLSKIENPYKGLHPFGEADAENFFGRDTLIAELLARLSEDRDLARFLAVIGPSGSGKSSVVKAGLIPALRRGALPGSENWFILDFMPGAHPFEELEAALLRVAVNPPENLLALLKENERGLLRAVRRILPEDPAVELVIVIDQFEELFTLTTNETERAAFLQSLLCAALEPRSRLRIVLTLRADFMEHPLRYMDFGDLLQQRAAFVLPLAPEELEQAITAPARQAGLQLEPALVSHMLRDIGDQPGALPLLQYALSELYERRDGRRLTLAAYTAIGGINGALAQRAEEITLKLGLANQEAARQFFLRLVTLGEGSQDTRRRVPRAEVEALAAPASAIAGEAASLTPSGMGEVIDAFGRYRLLTFDRDPLSRGPTVEVAHEALLRAWPRLRLWLDESRDALRTQRRLAAAAAEWQSSGQESGFLASGARLAQFQALVQAGTLALTQAEHAYLQASLAEQTRLQRAADEQAAREKHLERRSRRILNALLAVFLLAALVSGGLALWANAQRQEADKQRAAAVAQQQEADNQRQQAETQTALAETQRQEALRQASIGLAAAALQERQADPQRAVLLALEALEAYPYTPQAQQALAEIVQTTVPLRKLDTSVLENPIDFLCSGWSPDSRRFACESGRGTEAAILSIWDTASLKLLQTFPLSKYFSGMPFEWSPDGRRIVAEVATPDYSSGNYVVFDLETSSVITIETNTLHLGSFGWLPDSQVFYAHDQSSVMFWDTKSGLPTGISLTPQGVPAFSVPTGNNQIDLSPDGKQMAIGMLDGTVQVLDRQTGRLDYTLGLPTPVYQARLFDQARILIPFDNNLVPSQLGAQMVQWSPDGQRLLVMYYYQYYSPTYTIMVWDVSRQVVEYNLALNSPQFINWLPGQNALLAIGPSWLAVVDQAGERLRLAVPTTSSYSFVLSPDGRWLWSLDQLWDLSYLPQILATSGALDIEWSPDSQRLLTSKGIYTVWPRPIAEPTTRFPFLPEADTGLWTPAYDAAWAPDGQRAVLTPHSPYLPYISDAHSGQAVVTLTLSVKQCGEPDWFDCSGFTTSVWAPDGSRIATAVNGYPSNRPFINFWDPETGQGLAQSPTTPCWSPFLSFHPDSRLLASSCFYITDPTEAALGYPAQIWDARNGAWVRDLLREGETPFTPAFSPDGRQLAVGYNSGLIVLWDTTTWQPGLTFSDHSNRVITLDWSPDSRYVLSADDNMTSKVRIWRASSGEVVQAFSLPIATCPLGCVGDWSPDGQWLAFNNLLVYRAWTDLEALVAFAKENFVHRALTAEERAQFGLPAR